MYRKLAVQEVPEKFVIEFPIKLEDDTEKEKVQLVVTEDTGSVFDQRKYIKF
jgi:hypothetical protein